jgi:O-antigen ligase
VKQRRTAAHVPPSDEPSPRGVEQLLAAIATALLVLAALVPSESVTRGTGVTWAALWMVVLSASSVLSLYRRRTVALGLVDAAVLLLGMWIVLSAGLRAWQGEPRATWNAAWHWLAILAGFWVVRQLWQAPASRRALLAVMLAVSGGLAAHGLHQFAVTMPRYRADYEQADETSKRRMLLENGFDPDPAMPQRRHFEDRLKSTEPYATFGLANSLAGVLAAWWIVLIWLQLTPEVTRMSAARRAALAAVSLIILACLVLTKSRAAWLATAAGFAVTCAAHRQAIVRHRGWLGAGAAALLVILAAGAWLGALDRQILTEARISITYRFEYWRGATAMALDYPLFGCGPGNFQDYYTQYKLPAASETVADPHQLFLEVAATAGFPALAALLLVLAGAARTLWKSRGNHPAAAEPGPAAATPAAIYG